MTGAARLPAAVLFDVDGTLIDTYRLYVESHSRALAPYLGRTPGEAEIIARRPTSERGFLAGWVGAEHADACHAEMRRHYAELHGALSEGVYVGVREMLAALRAAGYPLGIVTGKSREGWEVTEAALGLGPFAAVVTDDDVRAPKPDPAGLHAALAQVRVTPGDAVYVGDSAADLLAGRAAGTRVAAVLWPKTAPGERERFLADVAPTQPDWILEHPADLTRLLVRWC